MYEYTLFQKKKKTVYRLISFAKEYKIEISKDSLTSLVIYLKKKKFLFQFNYLATLREFNMND